MDRRRLTDRLDVEPPPDARDTAAYAFLHELETLRLDNAFTWARETLTGIRDTVARTGTVTVPQRQAVDHIVHGLRPRPRRGRP